MDQLTIMRRANGELFTLTRKGSEHLALWPSLESAIHYKTRNPQLLVFSPASAASVFGQERLAVLQLENLGLFLLNDTGDARFRDGRKISWKEIENILAASSVSTDPLPPIDRLNDDGGNQDLANKKREPEELLAT